MNGKPYEHVTKLEETKLQRCGGTLVTCQHILTARHCVVMEGDPRKVAAYGYEQGEIFRPDQVRVGLGSNTRIGAEGSDAVVFRVQEIRTAESEYPGKKSTSPRQFALPAPNCVMISLLHLEQQNPSLASAVA